MAGILKAAKLGVLRMADRTGLGRLLAATSWRRNRLLILCYHSIALDDEHEWNADYAIRADRFAARLESLAEAGCSVLRLGDALERLSAGELPPRSTVLTFDDGSYDFYARALPLLQRHGYPATVYLSTYYAVAGLPVFPMFVSYVLWRARASGDVPSRPVTGGASIWRLGTASGRAAAHREIVRHAEAHDMDARQKNELAACTATALGVDYGALVRQRKLQLMTMAEVGEIARAGIDVELHTHRHRTPLDRELFVRELTENAALIEAATGRTPRHFCYPSGVQRPLFHPWLADAGVLSATTITPGLVSRRTNRFAIPRIVDGDLSASEFLGWLTGTSRFLPRRFAAVPRTRVDGRLRV